MNEEDQLKEIVRLQGDKIKKLEDFLMYNSKIDVFRQNRDIESLNKLIGARLDIKGNVNLGNDTVNATTIQIGNDVTGSEIGFFGETPVVQQPAITKPTGGATVDAEARTAVNKIIDALQLFGFTL